MVDHLHPDVDAGDEVIAVGTVKPKPPHIAVFAPAAVRQFVVRGVFAHVYSAVVHPHQVPSGYTHVTTKCVRDIVAPNLPMQSSVLVHPLGVVGLTLPRSVRFDQFVLVIDGYQRVRHPRCFDI